MTITSTVDQNTQIDPRDPVARLENLFDPASLEFLTEPDASGALAARGLIDGEPTIAYATDATVMRELPGSRSIVRAKGFDIARSVKRNARWVKHSFTFHGQDNPQAKTRDPCRSSPTAKPSSPAP